MGRKKKKVEPLKRKEEIWCYYCDTEFEDEHLSVLHQKCNHFKCHLCHKKLSTAGGMAIHVLQVHKETVSRVPNAKSDRDSTDVEIYGMQGIPPDVLAAHYGEEDGGATSKRVKVGTSSSQVVGGVDPRPVGISYNPAIPLPPIGWSLEPPRPELCFTQHRAVTVPPHASGLQPSLSAASELPTSTPVPISQPFFFGVTTGNVTSQFSPSSSPQRPTSVPLSSYADLKSPVNLHTSNNSSLASSYHTPSFPEGVFVNSHFYAFGPNTGGPLIGAPLVISNKAPEQATNEVYLVWEDEAMSLEERRMTLSKYQVHDGTSLMSSIDV